MNPLNEYTEDELRVISAGRDTDRLIARAVLGWQWRLDWSRLCPPNYPMISDMWEEKYTEEDGHHRVFANRVKGVTVHMDGEPIVGRYSTDTSDALRAVARMSELGYWAELCTPFKPGDDYEAVFTSHNRLKIEGEHMQALHLTGAPSLALAICRAALLRLRIAQNARFADAISATLGLTSRQAELAEIRRQFKENPPPPQELSEEEIEWMNAPLGPKI